MRVRTVTLALACVILAGCGAKSTALNPPRNLSVDPPVIPASQDVSETFTLSFTIRETSPVDAGVASVSWTLTRDGAAFLAGSSGTVVANGSLIVTTAVTESVPGSHDYVLTIDSSDRIRETDESAADNQEEFSLQWTSTI